MFYEAKSDFFYDPNSKLYYGNKQQVCVMDDMSTAACSLLFWQTYYRFDEETKRFEEVEKTATSATADDETNNLLPQTTKTKTDGAKISIKLKTKSLGSKAKKAHATEAKLPKVSTQHARDISKWTERQSEKETPTVPRTTKGEPICLLCRRKFPTLAKLEYHEKASQMHRDNLAQQQQQYVDRAQLRRDLQGPETHLLPQTPLVAPPPPVTAPPPEDTLGDSNIGNQLLRKLGWKPQQAASHAMTKDWQRIEAMAAQGRNTTGQSGIGGGSAT